MQPHEMPTVFPASSSATSDTSPEAPHLDESSPLPKVAGFLVEGELGRGGMGVVYLARQIRLNRLVALKMIKNADHSDPNARLRFLAEAEAIARLHHPGIVQVYEFGTHEGNPYFSLEYVQGGSLDKKLDGTPLPVHEAADLVEKLARAVQSAHELGIVHRDLKPANILLAEDSSSQSGSHEKSHYATHRAGHWQPKITDFGLVKKEGSDMTATGAILGTPSYMAPEQADGKKTIGPTVDIYALGTILYECLSGRPPFKAATPIDTILQVVNEEPVSIRQLQSKTPLDLETICLKCLQKDPAKRYTTASALADDLLHYLRNEPISARPVSRVEKAWRWCRRYPMVASLAASVVLLLTGVAVASLFINYHVSTINSQLSDSNEQLLSKNDELGAAKADALANAKQAREEREHARDLLSQQYEINAVRRMEENDSGGALLWSAAAIKEAGGNQEREQSSRMRFAQLLRTQPRPMQVWETNYSEHLKEKLFPQVTPNGQYIFLKTVKGIVILDLDSGKTLPVPPVPVGRNVSHAVMSQDGKYAVCTFTNKEAIPDGFQSALAAATARDPLSSIGMATNSCCFMLANMEIMVAWEVLTNRIIIPNTFVPNNWGSEPQFSQNGKRLYAGNSVYEASSGKKLSTLSDLKDIRETVFSPDGKRLLLVSRGTARLWNVDDQSWQASDFAIRGYIQQAVFDRDGNPLVTVRLSDKDHKSTYEIWDIHQRKCVLGPIQHKDGQGKLESIRYAELSPDRTRFLTACSNTINVWEIMSGKSLCKMDAQDSDFIYSDKYGFTGGGEYVWRTTSKGLVNLWSIASGKQIVTPFYHTSVVDSVELSAKADQLLIGDHDGNTTVWKLTPLPSLSFSKDKSMEYSTMMAYRLCHEGNAWWTALTPSGRHILTLSDSKQGSRICTVWNIARESSETRQSVSGHSPEDAQFIDHATSLFMTADNGIHVISTTDGKSKSHLKLPGAQRGRYKSSISPDGKCIAYYTEVYVEGKTTISLYSVELSKVVAVLVSLNKAKVKSISFSGDSTRCAAIIADDEAKRFVGYLWNTKNGEMIGTPLTNELRVNDEKYYNFYEFSTMFSPDSKQVWHFKDGEVPIVARQADTGLLLPSPGKLQGEFKYYHRATGSIITSTGKYSGEHSTMLSKWEQVEKPVWKSPFVCTSARFSPDGSCIAMASGDSKRKTYEVRVHDAKTGQALSPTMLHQGEVKLMCFGEKARLLATVTELEQKQYLHWWHTERGTRISLPLEFSAKVQDIAFSESGKQLLAIDNEGTLYRWDVPNEAGRPEALVELAQALSGRQLDKVGVPVSITFADRSKLLDGIRAKSPALLNSSAESLRLWYLDKVHTEKDANKKYFYFERLLALAPNEVAILSLRGNFLHRAGYYDQAADNYTKFISLAPANPEGWMGRGHARYHGTTITGNSLIDAPFSWDAAYEDLAHAIDRYPAGITNWNDLECPCNHLTSAKNAGMMRYLQAIKLLNRACRLVPDNIELHCYLGRAYCRLGDHESAIAVLSKYAEVKQNDFSSMAYLAISYHHLGKAHEAATWLDKTKAVFKKSWKGRSPLIMEAEALLRSAK